MFPAAAGETIVTVTLKIEGGRVRLDKMESAGSLAVSAVRPVVAAATAAFERCLGRDGTVELRLLVNAAGAVTRVEVLP